MLAPKTYWRDKSCCVCDRNMDTQKTKPQWVFDALLRTLGQAHKSCCVRYVPQTNFRNADVPEAIARFLIFVAHQWPSAKTSRRRDVLLLAEQGDGTKGLTNSQKRYLDNNDETDDLIEGYSGLIDEYIEFLTDRQGA